MRSRPPVRALTVPINITGAIRGVGVTTEMTMTEEECQEFLSTRREAGKHIDPTTAEVEWDYGEIMDPYGIDPDLPDELKCSGRIYFARSPGSDIWVCFDDLPEAVCGALWERHGHQLASFVV